MTAGMIHEMDFTRKEVGQALRAARQQCQHDPRWLTALNRAALNLEACRWAFDGQTLRIESAQGTGERYTVTAAGCECKAAQAGRPCHHRAAWKLLRNAAELSQRQAVILPFPSADELFSKARFVALTQACDDELFG